MRQTWPLPGGIHPPENKSQSLQRPIAQPPLPPCLVLPLNQHIGTPSVPRVCVGETVLKGQVVADAEGMISAALHAPTSGVIKAIETRPIAHPSGGEDVCIVLESDGEERWIELAARPDYADLAPAEVLALIARAGITGMGGAGFPSATKLQPRHAIDTLIINAAECEPYITADDVLMRERAPGISVGIDILAHVLGQPETILIGIEDNKPEAASALRDALDGSRADLVEIPTRYPSGGEKQLIQILTGKEVPSGGLPADIGIVCQNVGTTHAVFEAVCKGTPLISRITTVTGGACAHAGNFEVLIGTPVEHLLQAAGYDQGICQRLIMGGPMMGFTLADTDVPVVKSTNCLLAADAKESPQNNIPQACIRCGLCAEACPANLLPQQLYWYARARDYDKLAAHNLNDCIECGACAYVCPSEIPLVQYYRAAKGEIRVMQQEKIFSDHARIRFEFHKDRMEKAEREKAAKREQRKKAAEVARSTVGNSQPAPDGTTATDEDSDVVRAALARVQANKSSTEAQLRKLERNLEALDTQLNNAQSRLTEIPESDTGPHGKAAAAIEQIRVKRARVAGELEALKNQAPETPTDTGANAEPAGRDQRAVDKAAEAIARAQQRMAEQQSMSPDDKRRHQRERLEKRLVKARQRLAQAQTDGDENLGAYADAVASLEQKLTALQNTETTAEAIASSGTDTGER